MTRKRIIALLAVVVVAGLAVAMHKSVVAGADNGTHYRLDGTWHLTDVSGSVTTVTFAPATSANKRVAIAADVCNFDATLGGALPQASPVQNMALRGTAVRTGPNTFDYSWIVYSRDESRQIVYILIGEGSLVLTDANTYEDTVTIDWYSAVEGQVTAFGTLPDQDVDGDGLPDEGQSPFFSFEVIGGVGRRLESVLP